VPPVTRMHEAEIVSNRKLVSYGEFFIKSCTHRLSRWENDHVNKYCLPMPVDYKITYNTNKVFTNVKYVIKWN